MNPERREAQLNLPFEGRKNILEFGAGRGPGVETGSRNRSRQESDYPPKTLDGTVRHRASRQAMRPSYAARTLENQRQKAARLEREIRLLMGEGANLSESQGEKLRELTIELNLTRDVVREYELRMKAAG